MVIQHNLSAINTNRMMNTVSNAVSKTMEKLTSGYQINRAVDDAAGLAISEKMREQIHGLSRASLNAQDGISAVQTAEGALAEVHAMLQRMNELVVQAANGTNSQSDREAVQQEVDQLCTEIDRVAETTKFNETYLLKGSDRINTIYTGAKNAGFKGSLLGVGSGEATFTMNRLKSADALSIGGQRYTIGTTISTIRNAIAGTSSNIAVGSLISINGMQYEVVADGLTDQASNKYTKNELATKIVEGDKVVVDDKTYVAMLDQVKDGVSDSKHNIISENIAYDLIKEEIRKASSIGASAGHDASIKSVDKTQTQVIFTIEEGINKQVPQSLQMGLHVGAESAENNKIDFLLKSMNCSSLGIANLNIVDKNGAKATTAITAIEEAIGRVSEQRSSLGAVQNRLEHTIKNLDNTTENTTSAESRIRDADMASLFIEHTRNNILMQAGQSMLAQANSSSQHVLGLLR